MSAPEFPTPERVRASKDVEEVLRWHRFLPGPRNQAHIDSIGAVVVRLDELRTADDDAFVAASKRIGWDR